MRVLPRDHFQMKENGTCLFNVQTEGYPVLLEAKVTLPRVNYRLDYMFLRYLQPNKISSALYDYKRTK